MEGVVAVAVQRVLIVGKLEELYNAISDIAVLVPTLQDSVPRNEHKDTLVGNNSMVSSRHVR